MKRIAILTALLALSACANMPMERPGVGGAPADPFELSQTHVAAQHKAA